MENDRRLRRQLAHDVRDDVARIAVVSAFAPELALVVGELDGAATHSVNGVEFSVGTLQGRDVVLFDYPYANFGMMLPRSVTVQRTGAATPETRFWFPVDEALLRALPDYTSALRRSCA